mmetsp:Transcript_21804/g.54547  ORF Transcript_21804/g.54547 Transcript_21804/m.54547 type:complete len:202 (+) Transcript_21804:127-732(+)
MGRFLMRFTQASFRLCSRSKLASSRKGSNVSNFSSRLAAASAASFVAFSSANSRCRRAFSKACFFLSCAIFHSRKRKISLVFGLVAPNLATFACFASSCCLFLSLSAWRFARSSASTLLAAPRMEPPGMSAALGDEVSSASCADLGLALPSRMVLKNCDSRNLRSRLSSFSFNFCSRNKVLFWLSRTATARLLASTFHWSR